MSSLLSTFGISYFYHLRVSASQIKYSSQVLLSATQFLYSKSLATPINYYCPCYPVTAQATPYSRCYSLLYQLLFTVPANLINQPFQLLFSDTSIREHCHVLLSATRITYSYWVLLSVTLIYSYSLLFTLMYIQKYGIG